MIHFNRIQSLFDRLAAQPKLKDLKIKLKVSGVRSPRKNADGEEIPPKIDNDEIVTVIETDVDAVKVRNEKGVEVVFAHGLGASKLDLVNYQELVKALTKAEGGEEEKAEEKK